MSVHGSSSGPHLIVAALCEKVLTEVDGVLSVIRIVDQITQSASGPEAPDQMPPFILDRLSVLVALRSDRARGRYGIKLRPEAPGGFQLPPVEQPITLQAGSGANLVIALAIPISEEGTYWFDVFLTGPPPQEDRLLTRIPLQIVYAPHRPPVGPSSESES